jgi:hypothetical protein
MKHLKGRIKVRYHLLAAALTVTLSGGIAPALASECLIVGTRPTVDGTIVERRFTDTAGGKKFEHKFLAIAFDKPGCAESGWNDGVPTALMFLYVANDNGSPLGNRFARRWLGRHVELEAKVYDNGGTSHWPTVVYLSPLRIQENAK